MKPALIRLILLSLLWTGASGAAEPPIAVIVPAGAAHRLTPEDLTLIYLRKKVFWEDGRKIYPVNLPTEHPLRTQFSLRVLGQKPEAMREYWNGMYFHGVLPPHVLSSSAAVQQFVAGTPGAIGYVNYCKLDRDGSVAVLLVINNGAVTEPSGEIACPR